MATAVPILNYSTFYPNWEIPARPLDLVGDFNIEEVILMLVALRNSLERNRYDLQHDNMVSALISELPTEKSTRLRSFLFGNPQFTLIHSVVISKVLVDLFRQLSSNKPILDFEKGHYEERILDLILIYNEQHYDNMLGERAQDSHELVWGLMMMQNLSGVNEIHYARTGPIKHLIFLRYLRTTVGKHFMRFEQSLKDSTGMGNINQFLAIFLSIFSFLTKRDVPNSLLPQIDLEDPNYSYLKLMGLVLDRESVETENFDVGTLLTHPFFQTSDGKTYILDHRDFSLMIERVFMYVLYHKSNICELLAITNYNGMLGHFGLHYYERYLLNGLFTTMERPGVRMIASDDNNLSDFTLIVNETDVFIIEVKAVSVHYRVFDQQDLVGFKTYLDDNFSGKKGVQQLVRNISYLTNDRFKLLSLKKPSSKLNVFPIIVFVDPQAGVHGVNDYVSGIAEEKFEALRHNFKSIRPLTMISCDFFLENIELLQNDRSLFKRLIMSYHSAIQNRKLSYKKFPSTENYVKAMVGFDQLSIGKEGIYRRDQKAIFKNLVTIFKLKEKV
ncbi:hypothetical protein [Daejeonella lutea]|uniref:NERD domain-containing protein n=1 Tax=Daejeonella lutea TaxID=572036 RepID=A0A1T5B067_9SPHI|nr:hypothetical protein [Daejeonella lutea]SKB40648.1 hypothetical protein SAMN05661099_1171 [Daejeonella lutea]